MDFPRHCIPVGPACPSQGPKLNPETYQGFVSSRSAGLNPTVALDTDQTTPTISQTKQAKLIAEVLSRVCGMAAII
jgi:hypothetical protein